MDMVVDGIWIAGYREACETAAPEWAGIAAVLQLYGPEPGPLPLPEGPEVRSLLVPDGVPIPHAALREGVEFIRTQRSQGQAILVTCGLGQSRSPAFVAAYLHETGTILEEALALLIRRRPQILPHPALLRSLVEAYQLPTTAEALLVALVKLRREMRGASSRENALETRDETDERHHPLGHRHARRGRDRARGGLGAAHAG